MKFFSDLYLEMYEDLLIGKVDGKEHYFEHGSAEGRRPHPLIDVTMVKGLSIIRSDVLRCVWTKPLTRFSTITPLFAELVIVGAGPIAVI